MKKVLIIVRRSNGDVFLSNSLINNLLMNYPDVKIDLIVNQNTYEVAKTLNNISKIYVVKNKKIFGVSRYLSNIMGIFVKTFRSYDLSINLNSNDLSTLFAFTSSNISISAVDDENRKSWWKKLIISHTYNINKDQHMINYILKPLSFISKRSILYDYSPKNLKNYSHIKEKFNLPNKYIIFHPSAQFDFRSYPIENINKFLELTSNNNIPVVLTGGNDEINNKIKKNLITHINIINLIGKTTVPEIYTLISNSDLYIGMDTLTTHIAASFNKKIIAIYGPNSVKQWSPYNWKLEYSPPADTPPITNYGNFTIVQANMSCVPCNKNGCDGSGISDCLYSISPTLIYNLLIKKLN
jgi:heptosyltransferase-3